MCNPYHGNVHSQDWENEVEILVKCKIEEI